jgi:membrane-bound lytic murein transglycosylase B
VQAGDNGPIFIVYDNYRTTLLWNRSTYFALAVGHLADAITTGS